MSAPEISNLAGNRVFVNDILVYGDTEEEHDSHLDKARFEAEPWKVLH